LNNFSTGSLIYFDSCLNSLNLEIIFSNICKKVDQEKKRFKEFLIKLNPELENKDGQLRFQFFFVRYTDLLAISFIAQT